MVSRLKNFNFGRGGSLTNLTVKGGLQKIQYRGGRLPKKGGLELFADLKGGLARKRGFVFFRGGLRPQCTLWMQ